MVRISDPLKFFFRPTATPAGEALRQRKLHGGGCEVAASSSTSAHARTVWRRVSFAFQKNRPLMCASGGRQVSSEPQRVPVHSFSSYPLPCRARSRAGPFGLGPPSRPHLCGACTRLCKGRQPRLHRPWSMPTEHCERTAWRISQFMVTGHSAAAGVHTLTTANCPCFLIL